MSESRPKEMKDKGIDTRKHFKIWFSANPDEWMPIRNQRRLIRHQEHNNDKENFLQLIGAKRLLSEKSKVDLDNFCRRHKISYLDIDEDLPGLIAQQTDRSKRDKDLIISSIGGTFFSSL